LVIVLVFGLILASRVTRPIAALGRGIDRVAAGDLDTTVPVEAGGEIATLVTNFNEMVTRLRTQQADLVRLEKIAAWRQMSRRLAHEIKNPLTPIQLAAEQMRDSYSGADPDHRQFLDEACGIIEEEVAALRSLVSEFSQFARMPEPQVAPVDVSELCGELAGLYGDDTITVRVTPSAPTRIRCDSNQIHRMLINVINNALEAQSDVGCTEAIEITVDGDAASPGGGDLRIRVADRGPGIPETDRRRIFEPDVTTKPQGMGLGLAIVANTVERHGGTIAIGDREAGGTVFTITLPVRSGPTGGETE
jgi:nitrogen fixation/metabolism regulation signal transduction histidine kinase